MTQQISTLIQQTPGSEQGAWLQLIPISKWVRVLFGGQVIASSKRVWLLRRSRARPTYYFPVEDVCMDFLTPGDATDDDPLMGPVTHYSIHVGAKTVEQGAWALSSPPSEAAPLQECVAFTWGKMDAWFEENEEVFAHARDPYKRIDIIQSNRHVQVIIAGEVVADTHNPVLLFETDLPTRYYIPKTDARMDLLVPSDTVTRCPYKGQSNYYSVAVGDTLAKDIVWYYQFPLLESVKIAGLLAFYGERVDAFYVDDELQTKPKTLRPADQGNPR